MLGTVNSAGRSARALFGRIGVALLLCFALTGAGVYWVNNYIDEEIDRIPRIALTTSTVEQHGTNFLIVGSDTRQFVDNADDAATFGDPAKETGQRSDTMMVLHANGDRSYAVSFPRDTWVSIAGQGNAKLNAAFNSGPQTLIDTLQQTFNIPINHYLEVDFRSFSGLVDAIGGVPVYMEHTTKDEQTGLLVPFPNTCYQFDGAQALAYVRSRYPQYFINGKWVDGSGLADLDRIDRQQAFVKTLGRVAMERALDNPRIAPDIADNVIPNLHADEGFDRTAFNALARAFVGLGTAEETSIEFTTLPTERATRGGQDAQVVVQAEADPMLAILRGDVVPEPPATTTVDDGDTAAPSGPTPSDVRVTVRNGSGVANQAGTTLNDLGNRGFVRGTPENNPSGNIARSEVRYRPGDEAKAALVAAYVKGGADLVADSSLSSDVVLVVGRSFSGVADTPTAAPAAPAAPATPADSPAAVEAACR
jgi:LCP family protein required for cell wall assembly